MKTGNYRQNRGLCDIFSEMKKRVKRVEGWDLRLFILEGGLK